MSRDQPSTITNKKSLSGSEMVTGDTITGTYAESEQVLDDLAAQGISYSEVVDLLEVEAVDKFEKAWGELLAGVTTEIEKVAK